MAGLNTQTELAAVDIQRLHVLKDIYAEIPVLLLDAARPVIEDAANATLRELGSAYAAALKSTVGENKSNDNVKDTLDIWVTDSQGYESLYEMCSGGERFMLDIALREGLAQLQAARTVDDLPMLVIDEGFASVDPDKLSSFAEVLDRVVRSGRYSMVLCVSHVQQLIDTFQTRLVVSKGGDGSTVQVLRAA